MTSYCEPAPAKVNLTLQVAGVRADGFHEISSLVVFADIGDSLAVTIGASPTVTVSGPFADRLQGANILDRALALVEARAPRVRLGRVDLIKTLPVAAGLGGGSADAGALLRVLRQANPELTDDVDWRAMSAALGSDVPVCFRAEACWMTGAGASLAQISGGVPVLDAVMVNPLAAVAQDKTARVFRALGAGALAQGYAAPPPPTFSGREALLDFVRARGNDLTQAAVAVVPETDAVLEALAGEAYLQHVAVSGAGPTAFAVFPDAATAHAARARLASRYPHWWIAAVRLG